MDELFDSDDEQQGGAPPDVDNEDGVAEDEEDDEEGADNDEEELGPGGIDLRRTADEDELDDEGGNGDEDSDEDGDEYRKRKRGDGKRPSGKKKKKKNRSAISSLLQMEALEDSDEEDEDEDEGGGGRGGRRDRTAAEAEEDRQMEEAKRLQDARRTGQANILEDDSDAVVSRLKNRSRLERQQEKNFQQMASMPGHGGMSSLATVTRVQPTIMDKVFVVRTNGSGKEREAVLSLMSKMVHLKKTTKPNLAVTSVFTNGSRGVVYLESRNEIDAKLLVAGMKLLKAYTVAMVPVGDLTTVVSIKSATQRAGNISKGAWVRVKRLNPYRGDLARVVALTQGGTHAVVQVEPRLDYSSIEEEYNEDDLERKKEIKAKAKARPTAPPQKPFDYAALSQFMVVERSQFPRAHGMDTEEWADAHEAFYLFEGSYYLNGFLYREVPIETTLDPSTVMPTIEQVHRFLKPAKSKKSSGDYDNQSDDENEDEDEGGLESHLSVTEALAKATEEAAAMVGLACGGGGGGGSMGSGLGSGGGVVGKAVAFARGDRARVVSGDNAGLVGTVLTVDQMQRTVKLEILKLAGQEVLAGRHLEYSCDDLCKHILAGAHVRVVEGVFAGETGSVVKVVSAINQAFVFTDLAPREIEVRLSDLQESMEEAQGLAELMGFKLFDLVGIEATVAGIVVGVGREELTVLDNFGTTRQLKPQQVRGSRNRESSQANAFDADGAPLKENAVVSVLVGQNSSSGGGATNAVKRIFKATVFLHSKERTHDSGIVVCRARDVRQVGRAPGQSVTFAAMYMGGLDAGAAGKGGKGGGKGGKGGGKGGPLATPAIVGKTCVITKGKLKGLQGICVSATDTHVRVELHSRHSTETLPIGIVKPRGDDKGILSGVAGPGMAGGGGGRLGGGGGAGGASPWGIDMATPYLVGQTPLMGAAQTPLHSMTPLHGSSMTPMHTGAASPSRSDVWAPGAGDTPQHTYDPFDDMGSMGGASPSQNSSVQGSSRRGDQDDEYDPSAAAHHGGASPSAASVLSNQTSVLTYGTKSMAGDSEYDPLMKSEGGGTPRGGSDPFESGNDQEEGGEGQGGDYDSSAAANPFAATEPWCSLGAELTLSGSGGALCKVVNFASSSSGLVTVQMKAPGGGSSRKNATTTTTVRPSTLKPVVPLKSDRARAFQGDYAGKQGDMDGVDGDDGILKVMMFGEMDYCIVQMCDLVKLADW